MPTKEKKPPTRASKESKGTARGARPVRLTELQKALMNGGICHHNRNGKSRRPAEDTKAGKRAIAQAKAAEEKEKSADRKKKSTAKAAKQMHVLAS